MSVGGVGTQSWYLVFGKVFTNLTPVASASLCAAESVSKIGTFFKISKFLLCSAFRSAPVMAFFGKERCQYFVTCIT
jgi:hypothetical protein